MGDDTTNRDKSFLSKLFPIFKGERVIFFSMAFIIALKIFIYTSVRQLKDTMVKQYVGAVALPFCKFMVLFGSSIFFVFYALGITVFDRRKLFYIVTVLFVSYFVLFGFFIKPNLSSFILSENMKNNIIHWLGNSRMYSFFNHKIFSFLGMCSFVLSVIFSLKKFCLKKLCKQFVIISGSCFSAYSLLYYLSSPKSVIFWKVPVTMIQYWPILLFYIVSELCAAFMLQLLFWDFANHQVDKKKAVRFYPAFLVIGQIGQFFGGLFGVYVNSDFIISLLIMFAGMSILGLHEFVYRSTKVETSGSKGTMKKSTSLIEAVKATFAIKEARLIAITVLCYGLGLNCIEFYWKLKLEAFSNLFSNSAIVYKTMLSKFNMLTSLFAAVFALFGSMIISYFSWFMTAISTPLIMTIGSILFYGSDLLQLMDAKMLVWIGGLCLVLFRSTKYTLFDSSKELVMVTLDKDVKSQCKLTDAYSSRIGKVGGSGFQQVLLVAFNNNYNAIGFKVVLLGTVLAVALSWTYVVYLISKYNKSKLS